MSNEKLEVVARMASAASQILQAGSRTPDIEDDKGWRLFTEAVEAVNRYSGHMFKMAREAKDANPSPIVKELRAWSGDDSVPADLTDILIEAAAALEIKDEA